MKDSGIFFRLPSDLFNGLCNLIFFVIADCSSEPVPDILSEILQGIVLHIFQKRKDWEISIHWQSV